MRWGIILVAIALMVLWAVVRFALAVTSALIHIVLAIAVVLFIIGLIRAATHRSDAP